MAYQPRPPYEHNPPIQEPQHHPPPWTHRHRVSGQEQLPMMRSLTPGLIEPESEDSDVSGGEDDVPTFVLPVGLPPALSKSTLDNQQYILGRLDDLERHENHNIKKHNRLKEKRQRMDDRITHKRAKQDEMIKAIMNARSRHDSRIKARRDREDIAYQRFYEDVEEEESRLRQRLKRLKRGLPVEDNPGLDRSLSFNSPTSPVPTSYSTIPPPAKRRRTSQPPYTESPASRPPDMMQHQLPPVERHPYPYHPHHGPPPATPYGNQSHHPTYHPPPLQSPKNNHSRPPPDLSPYPQNGYHNSPHAPPAAPIPPTSTPTQAPRPLMSTYDTRPPPTAPISSGFAAVNQPQHSGFAAVNARHAETPPAMNAQLMREPMHKQSSTPVDETPVRPSLGDEKGSSGSGSAANKRTPSTTHPYQMSEAFANRHHHCERLDSISRGIWTWYGQGGTQDRPTAPPTEMYLKCNHDNCGRIDWKTVHGLQCHIVKNHEQPKGTIGSLEKALAAYGVPVREIEEIEKRDGLGSGGTMADPKNIKVRAKMKDSGDRRDLSGRDTPVSIGMPPSMNKQRSSNSDSPTAIINHRLEPDKRPSMHANHAVDGSATSPIDIDKPIPRPTGFAAVNSSWPNVNQKLNPAPPTLNRDNTPRELATPDRQAVPASGESRSPPAPRSFWSGWQPKPSYSSPRPQPPIEPGSQHSQQTPLQQGEPANPSTDNALKPSTMLSLEREAEENKAAKMEIAAAGSEKIIAESKPVEVSPKEVSTEAKDTPMEDVPVQSKSEDAPKEEDPKVVETEARSNPTVEASIPEIKATEKQAQPNAPPAPADANPVLDGRIEEHPVETPTKEPITGIKEEAKTPQSPEVSNKRVVSRRESRRASIATATSSRLGTEKGKDDDRDAGPSRAATENTVDEDDDTIQVSSASKVDQKERDRLKDEDRNQTPPRRLANGRFTRRSMR